jgi:hypothetical protein
MVQRLRLWDATMSYRERVPLGRPSLSEVYGAMARRERRLWFLALVNFLVFVAVAVPLGGDALNGTVRDGHYYLMQHGRYTEVSRPVFIYSAIHTLSLFVRHPWASSWG